METHPTTFYQVRRAAGSIFALLVLASLAYCPLLFHGLEDWGRGDWDQFTFRYATPRLAICRDGELPLWNPYVNGGNVLLAHPHCPALSPWYLPVLALGVPLGVRVQVVLFMALGTTGIAVLLRRWNISSAGQFVGGMLLMMSAHFALHVTEGHLEWCALGLMPWTFLCLLRAAEDWRWTIAGGALVASVLLHGAIYILAVFVPLFVLWAVLEGIRTGAWRAPMACGATMALALLLGAVVTLPRLEFVWNNPRPTPEHSQVAPQALPRMLLDPFQADLFRATRDTRNPPPGELARRLDPQPSVPGQSPSDWRWRRLDITLSTTSDWTDVQFSGISYVLIIGKPEYRDRTPEELDAMPLSSEGLAIQNPQSFKPTAKSGSNPGEVESQVAPANPTPPRREAALHATMYVRRPRWRDLKIQMTRGDDGDTRLSIKYHDNVLLSSHHQGKVPGDPSNRLRLILPRKVILAGERTEENWRQVEIELFTTSDWCDVEVPDAPYLFRVEEPAVEVRKDVGLWTRPLAARSPAPSQAKARVRAILCFQCPAKGDLRLVVRQGVWGTSRLYVRDSRGALLPTVRNDLPAQPERRSLEYLVDREAVHRQLEPMARPWQWRLNEMGMTYDWHEYGCYLTWAGLALSLFGLIVLCRRQWPLVVAGGAAGLVVLGAALPVDLWALLQCLPLYGSLQAPSRFLAAVVFVLAIAAGFGMDRLGRWIERVRGPRVRRGLEVAIASAIYLELALLGWNLFSDIFACPSRFVLHEGAFAQRYAEDEVRYAAMYSAHYPYLTANSGVLRDYENIAVPRGKVRVTSDPGYRGEVYLQDRHGAAEIAGWTMSRVNARLNLAAPDRLLLNQNYFAGWKVSLRRADGSTHRAAAERSDEGLVSMPVAPGDVEATFYYLPDSFLCGAGISGFALLACVGLLVAGRRGWSPADIRPAAGRALGWLGRPLRSRWWPYLAAAGALNLPFVLFQPLNPLVPWPLARSLAINAVLFLMPGLPLIGIAVGRGWLPRIKLLWVMVSSLLVFLAVLTITHLAGRPPEPETFWNATWIVTNLAVLLNAWAGGPPMFWSRRTGESTCRRLSQPASDENGTVPLQATTLGLILFVGAYVAYYHGATRLVPAMEDHDYITQGTGHGLLHQLQPRLLTDRNISLEFAHPPLLHFCVAGSFLYFNQLEPLARYEAALQRVEQASRDEPTEPRLPRYKNRVPVRDLELEQLYEDYRRDPHRLETRTPNLFLAALTVALVGMWLARLTGRWQLAALVAVAYATSPEVFVRSAIGGYFSIDQFAILSMLLGLEAWSRAAPAAWADCFLAGAFAGLADHKVLLLPLAVVLWELVRLPDWKGLFRQTGDGWRPVVKALMHPLALGFAAGIALFWAYGLAVNPAVFWADHVRTHLLDRAAHNDPFHYKGYPGVFGLWTELWRHTGYILLPLGVAAMVFLARQQGLGRTGVRPAGEGGSAAHRPNESWAGAWALWMLLTAVVFSAIDWRQTKHLMPLLLPLCLAPARWAAASRVGLVVVSVLITGLVLWNFDVLRMLWMDFNSFPVTPDW